MAFIFISHTTKNAPQTNFSMASGISLGVSPPSKFIPTAVHRQEAGANFPRCQLQWAKTRRTYTLL